jgi:hypothetical protein
MDIKGSVKMKKIIGAFIISFLLLFAAQALAYELLVLSGETSQNSKRWKEEVFPEFANSKAGKGLSVKIVTFKGANFPDWIAGAIQENRVGEIIGTPTFIIWDAKKKQEVGRVEGYTQKPRFYSQIDEALAMVEQGMHPGQREGSGGDHREEGSGGAQHQEEGASTSKDIMDHMYKTPEEAKKASEMLGLGGEIHSHETPNGTIYMPGSTM